MTNPTTTIVLAEPGAGATLYLLEQLREVLAGPGWPQAWLLTPDRATGQHLRQRLFAEMQAGGTTFNIRFLRFHSLAAALTGLTDEPALPLREDERLRLLQTVLLRLEGEGALQVFARDAVTPGMLRAIAGLLDELQINAVTPDAFLAAARSPRERELATIARRYRQTLVDKRRQDRSGRLAEACAALDDPRVRDELAGVDLLLATGFDCFTPLQAQLLVAVAHRVRRARIVLPTLPGREDGAGLRFQQALDILQTCSPGELRVERLSAGPASQRSDLQRLVARLFSGEQQVGGRLRGLHLLEAPDPAREMRAITRRIVALLLESETRPEDCLIALRDWKRHAGPLRAAGREHGVPLAFARGERLVDQPAIRHLLNLLELSDVEFPLQETLDALRAPCFRAPGLGHEEVAVLERLGRKAKIRGGREAWLRALDESCEAGRADVALAFRRFTQAVTPPGDGDAPGLWLWLRRLCGLDPIADADDYSLDMTGCLSSSPSAGIGASERAALEALDGLSLWKSRAAASQPGVAAGEQGGLDHWRRDLRAALERTCLEGDGSRSGAVTVVDATTARNLEARHVFIPGLSAGIFPPATGMAPLLLASERQALANSGADIGAGSAGGDDALFAQLLGTATETLFLTRPTEENGNSHQASHLWRALLDVAPHQPVERIRPGSAVPPGEVASVNEALVALATTGEPTASAALRQWLQGERPGLPAHVDHARRVEAGRLSPGHAHDRFSGLLADEGLIAQVADLLGPERPWSASQLNDLGAGCYRFLAGRLLGLDELWQPETGLNPLELGRLNHAILEAVYREVNRRQLTIDAGNLDEALAILECRSKAIFDNPRKVLEREPDALWPWEQRGIRARLEAFMRLDFSQDSPVGKRLSAAGRRSLWQEYRFGYGDMKFSIPLVINGQPEDLKLRGFIDRLDAASGAALVIDYKSGSSPIPTGRLAEGIEVQMLVYLRAAEQLLRQEPALSLAGGAFLQLRSPKISGAVSLNESGERSLQAAEGRVAANIAAARRGDFRVQPRQPAGENGRCTRYCEFWQLCRLQETRSPAREDAQ